MKKTILLILFLILFINVSHAQKDERWVIISKDDSSEFSLDTETISAYTYGKNVYLGCWIRTQIKDQFLIEKFYFNVETNRYLREKSILYKKNGREFVGTEDLTKEGWKEPVPGSKLEYCLKSTSNIVSILTNLISSTVAGPHE